MSSTVAVSAIIIQIKSVNNISILNKGMKSKWPIMRPKLSDK